MGGQVDCPGSHCGLRSGRQDPLLTDASDAAIQSVLDFPKTHSVQHATVVGLQTSVNDCKSCPQWGLCQVCTLEDWQVKLTVLKHLHKTTCTDGGGLVAG